MPCSVSFTPLRGMVLSADVDCTTDPTNVTFLLEEVQKEVTYPTKCSYTPHLRFSSSKYKIVLYSRQHYGFHMQR